MVELPSWHSKGGGFSSAALGGSAALPSGVQQRCPRAPAPEPGEGRRPKDRHSQTRNVFLPGCSVFSLSWPSSAGAFLVDGRWFSGPAPSGSSLFWFRLVFLSTGRGRHVPAPSGRDVGSSAGAPTQEPAQGGPPKDQLLQVSLYVRRCCVPHRACLALPLPLCYFIFRRRLLYRIF